MKKGIKIVTIGGGSSYTPELMEGFIKRYEELPIREIWLVDIEAGKEKLAIVGKLAQRMWDASPYDVSVHLTLDRREALKDADFVTTQFRVGLLEARIKDERIPLSYGMLGQETNGAGGMFKALRTIPVIAGIIADMRALCPDAWLINFTNPSGMITEAIVRQFGWKRCIGLCNVPVNSVRKEPALIGKTPEELEFRFAGLNHFHWHRVFTKDGQDITQDIIPHLNDSLETDPKNIFKADFPLEALQAANLLPCSYHRYYYSAEEMLQHCLEDYEKHATRAETVKETETRLFEIYKSQALHEKPKELEQRGGTYYSDAACECINAIHNNKGTLMVVSTENNGSLPDLPSDAIVEVSSRITSRGAEPLAWGPLAPHERGWLQLMKAMEECIIEAAVTGDYKLVCQAFNLNPAVTNGPTARRILHELFIAHAKYLPQFADTIAALQSEGITPKDKTVQELLAAGK